MIFDLNKVDSDPFKDKAFDVCICGAGVAGITLARKLSQKLEVALLEAGSYEYTDESQRVYGGTSIGREYFDLKSTRLRFFGGTSNHWSGMCRPLDSYDFETKSYVELSGWPIARSDLDPYLKEAISILDIPERAGIGGGNSLGESSDAIGSLPGFRRIEFWLSAPTRFGVKYKDRVEQLPNLSCYLNANLVDITLVDNFSKVEHVEIRNYAGKVFKIKAAVLILAGGGIENPRILLNCNNQIKEGLGNEKGLVGRYFTEHPHHTVGSFILEDHVREDIKRNWIDSRRSRQFFSPTHKVMKEERILNYGLRFQPYEPGKDDAGISFKDRLRNIICGSDSVQGAIAAVRGEKIWCPPDGLLRIASEQALNHSSRISLGRELDKFGKRRVVLDWRLSEIDKRTIHRAVMRFGLVFAESGLGRVRIADWLLSEEKDIEIPSLGQGEAAGNHHMCTTRMGDSPLNGVVDSNQRVFGINNLYLAGSSAFSTGGHANPTFTIVQMTLRLADHLNGVFKNRI